jgi:hypothetical protein
MIDAAPAQQETGSAKVTGPLLQTAELEQQPMRSVKRCSQHQGDQQHHRHRRPVAGCERMRQRLGVTYCQGSVKQAGCEQRRRKRR